jgi:3-oxoacyl-[acyl-carrier protein] reductase
MKINLKNKTAFVCGSTQGIGLATAKLMAEAGANLVLLARNEEKLKEILESLPAENGQIHRFIIADFSQPQSLKEALEKALPEIADAHILVNNTGGPAGGNVMDADVNEFVNAFSQHLICNQILVQALVPYMKKNRFGRIVNVISTSVKQPIKGLGVSNTVRGAVANWAKTLSFELAPFGITVNNVLPGATKTERLSSLVKNKAKKLAEDEAKIENEMLAEIPAGRFAEPEEIAAGIGFLCSDYAAYINGINLPIDGGRTGNL